MVAPPGRPIWSTAVPHWILPGLLVAYMRAPCADLLGVEPGQRRGPLGGVPLHVLAQLIEADAAVLDKGLVVQPFPDDHIQPGQG